MHKCLDLSSSLCSDDRDRRALFFSVSFKSVATGLPMATMMFSSYPDLLGAIAVPLLSYAIFQSMIGGFIADRWSR